MCPPGNLARGATRGRAAVRAGLTPLATLGEVDDAEILDLAKAAVGSQFGLTAQQSARLRGDTAEALKADAKLMQTELGIHQVDDRERDGKGRYRGSESKQMNDAIRQAAGR